MHTLNTSPVPVVFRDPQPWVWEFLRILIQASLQCEQAYPSVVLHSTATIPKLFGA